MQSGTRLGPYEIVAPIGAGGMGEVYRARDTRLGRTVAIKVLPSDFAWDARLRARFEREAKAISALSHPHICTLHDVGHESGTDYIVLEHCEGKTIARRLADGPLPLEKLIEYAIQIADALEAAHRQGIVHRDLKPSNIMLTKSGVKVLDFGLAKESGTTGAEATTVEQLSEDGALIGTVQYMAPEVLGGSTADTRSDIFALGLVMYEMAAGKPAFSGASKAGLIAAILERAPQPVRELRSDLNPLLQHIIDRCLEKDPEARWQSVADVGSELRFVAHFAESPDRKRPRRTAAVAALLVVTALAAGSLATLWITRQSSEPSVSGRFQLQPPSGIEVMERETIAISPDGKRVVFRGSGSEPQLFIRSTQEVDARPLTAGRSPFFSPDGQWVGFSFEGLLRKVRVDGGEAVPICPLPSPDLRGATWGPGGDIVFSAGTGLLRVSSGGGVAQPVTTPRPGERHYWPRHLPDGRSVLYLIHNGIRESRRQIAVLSLATGQTTVLITWGGTPHYSPSGHLVFGRAGGLWAASFDAAEQRLTGEPQAVLDDIHGYYGSGFTAFALSDSGALVYVPGAPRVPNTTLVSTDREGNETRLVPDARPYVWAPVPSPDGTRLLVNIVSGPEESDLWIYDLKRALWSRVTRGGETFGGLSGEWSSDGQSIYYSSTSGGHRELFRIGVDGTGRERLTAPGRQHQWAVNAQESPDGKTIIFNRQMTPSNWDIVAVSLGSLHRESSVVSTPAVELLAGEPFSPDGRWITYTSTSDGPSEVYIRPWPGPGPSRKISSGGGEGPSWNAKTGEVNYFCGRAICAVKVATDPLFIGPPVRLFSGEHLIPDVFALGSGLSISPDGQRFWTVRVPPETSPPRRLVYIPNWTSELTR